MKPFPSTALPTPALINWSRYVPAWSLGGNDKYGDCTFVSLCNVIDLATAVAGKPEIVTEAEAELFYAREAQFSPVDPSSDKGAVLADVIEFWRDNGWPADPELTLRGAWSVRKDQILAALHLLPGLPAWCMLPSLDDDPDFSDGALTRREVGIDAHAALIVDAGADTLTLVTWAELRIVSRAWWREYGREVFGVLPSNWRHPEGLDVARILGP